MGHAFQHTVMDALIRHKRMSGCNTLWQAGTDHAGIATQMVVERQLIGEGKTRHDLGRDDFIDRVWKWKAESGSTITKQLRRSGASMDWSRERFTMDEGLSKAVTEVFVQLYKEDLIYRGKRLVNWDPVLHTAVSDLEVNSEEENGSLWSFKYPLVDNKDKHIIVATTRPETMLGDSAVAVHPEDERYRHLIGKFVHLPMTDRQIPVIADSYVDPEFGTGCVKITPAHDFNDYDVGKRHDLPLINIFTEDARINENAPERYQGMNRFDARKIIVEDMKCAGLLEEIKPHKLMVPRGDRTNAVIEPYLTDQWYVKAEPLAKPARDAVEDGRIKFIPSNWDKTYFEWMRNIEDWCISRQIWWGHRIPAWYDADGNVYVGRNEAEVRAENNLGDEIPLEQDNDVLDTWFSSALWPFSTLGWPENTPELETFYPTSVLVTGFDIIFFWVARMIMMGMKFMDGEVPFKEVYIHGLVRDSDGQKMSKSKGNVLDPLDLIDGIDLDALVKKRTTGLMQPQMAPKIEQNTQKHFPEGISAFGTDAMRFTFASLATTGRDIAFDVGRIEGYRNFCNKLWNAARFVMSNISEGETFDEITLGAADKWIISKLETVKKEVEISFGNYRIDLASHAIYDFIWSEYCDWYIELSKTVIYNSVDRKRIAGTKHTLINMLETILRLLHPFMPFITEEIWQKAGKIAGKSGDTIMLQQYPVYEEVNLDEEATKEIEWLKTFLLGIRRIRGEMNISPGKPLQIILKNASNDDKALVEANKTNLLKLGKIDDITMLKDGEQAPESAIAIVGEMEILVPMAGLIDKESEIARIKKEMEKLQKDLDKSKTKLGNPNFVDKAPETVVNKEKERVAEMESSLSILTQQLKRIEKI
ncbi:MAG: valine--tRNA ligase [Gammaproteobacteria bacterium]|nr:MAG: valine--tRNA ligase [Gammaproteobacteria bacterium]